MLKNIHQATVYSKRIQVISSYLSEFIQPNSKVLDVGSGDGEIAGLIQQNTGCSIEGVDVVARETNRIPIHLYDGKKLPFEDNAFDTVIFSDVLHHTESPKEAMAESIRVASKRIIIKDHLCENFLDYWTLRFMDWVGNSYLSVPLPYNYMSLHEWESAFLDMKLDVVGMVRAIPLYIGPLQVIFGRNLHFIACLDKADK